jgi:hypothetical protein
VSAGSQSNIFQQRFRTSCREAGFIYISRTDDVVPDDDDESPPETPGLRDQSTGTGWEASEIDS